MGRRRWDMGIHYRTLQLGGLVRLINYYSQAERVILAP